MLMDVYCVMLVMSSESFLNACTYVIKFVKLLAALHFPESVGTCASSTLR